MENEMMVNSVNTLHPKDPLIICGLCPNILVFFGSSILLFCAGFLRRYFSLSFYPINMKFGHDIPRVVMYDFSKSHVLPNLSGFSGSLYPLKSKGSFCLLVR